MRHFLIALQFLTPIRIGKACIVPDRDLAKSMAWFGLVGFLIGLVLAGACYTLRLFLPDMVVSAIIVLFMVAISGGLHIDGLADTFDGLAGGKDKTGVLRIMRDSNIGAIGAAAIFACLLIKFSSIYSANSPVKALILSSIFSRWAFVFSAVKWQAADYNGLGSKFIKYVGIKELLWPSLVISAAALFLFGVKSFILIPIVVLSISLFNNFIKNKIGGLTGDTLGAAGEFAEVLSLILCAAY